MPLWLGFLTLLFRLVFCVGSGQSARQSQKGLLAIGALGYQLPLFELESQVRLQLQVPKQLIPVAHTHTYTNSKRSINKSQDD